MLGCILGTIVLHAIRGAMAAGLGDLVFGGNSTRAAAALAIFA
jgi:hypothetical protein